MISPAKIIMYAADEIEAEYRQMAARRKCAIVAYCLCIMSLEALSE